MIFLVTSTSDLTADYLIRRIEDRRLPVFRFNTEDLLSQYEASLVLNEIDAYFVLYDRIRDVTLRSSDIRGAYFRKPEPPTVAEHTDEGAGRAFEDRELEETLRSIWRIIPKEKWLNSPEALWQANNKVKQLLLARDIGFTIPDTLISTTSREMLEFAKAHGNDVIIKAVKNGFQTLPNSTNLIFTSALSDRDFELLRTSNNVIPSILQPRLEKQCDLRITVVGESVFPVSLLSQEHIQTSTDWRTWDLEEGLDLVHEPFELPTQISNLCLELNRRLDLRFSCIDMVLTKDGKFYFLEVNPNGQWAWIEDLVGLPVRDAIVDELIREQ